MVIGGYPANYNSKIHGPFDPSRNYARVDTAFKDVKLGEMSSWLSRRNPNPFPAINRAYWAWSKRWILPKKPSAAGLIQACMAMSLFYYVQTYPFLKYHRHTKYH